MKLLDAGDVIDGFEIIDCVHAGGMAHIYTVKYAHDGQGIDKPDPGFVMAMKIPRMTAGDGSESIVSFEVEQQIMPVLTGKHVPRYVTSGDLDRLPYIVMEYIEGKTIQNMLDEQEGPFSIEEISTIGAAMATAVHSLHKQNVCHLDIKPANVLIREDGSAVTLDFGLSCHAHYPDLLAEQNRKAVGSPVWIAPEQVVGVRGDPRSDIFAMGIILYEMATRELAHGSAVSENGMRRRLWYDPPPPRKLRADIPEWLQEIIMRCLEPEAAKRYPSASHLAFDLTHPTQVTVTERGKNVIGTSFGTHFKRWLKAAGMEYKPSPLPTQQIEEVPIIMVSVPHKDVTDATLYSLREAVSRSLGIRPGARLACVTVISPNASSSSDTRKSETSVYRQYLSMLQQWAQPLDLTQHQVSYHVLESSDVADAILKYAENNHVNMIIMGAATHGLQMQKFVATVPIKVAMYAPCTIILVKQTLPFSELAEVPLD
ncbi:MAG: serine/threonine protein kinase [Burkholderiaceae bacterium]|nr:serine/threonine protein kinase [Burkholderiaceae bacterium]